MKKEKKEQLDLSKFPRLSSIKEEIKEQEELVSLFNKRIDMLSKQDGNLTDYQLNENRILVLQTKRLLAKSHHSIFERNKIIGDYIDKYVTPYTEEVFSNFDKLMKEASIKAKRDKVLEGVLKDNPITVKEQNHEILFNHYLSIKNYLYPQKNRVSKKLKTANGHS